MAKAKDKRQEPPQKGGSTALKPATGNGGKLVAAAYHGPIPPASELAHYEEIHPGAAAIILESFKQEGLHRRNMEQRYCEMDRYYLVKTLSRAKLGTWLGFLVALAALGLSAYMASLGHSNAATWLGGGVLVSLAGVFVYGTRQREPIQEEPANPKKQH